MEQTDKTAEAQPVIWAVGGGKGGTGKTFIASQLGTMLAELGHRTVIIDCDFGGANLHNFFGIAKPAKSLQTFFDAHGPLDSLLLSTQLPNLRIIAGDNFGLSTGSIQHSQKQKFFRQLKQMDQDMIILDVGAGVNHLTLDVFLNAQRMITVCVPEITAVENLFLFIKHLYSRRLQALFKDTPLRDQAKELWTRRIQLGLHTLPELIRALREMAGPHDDLVTQALRPFPVSIVLNKVRNASELKEGFTVKSLCLKYLGVDARFSGYLSYDYQFRKNLQMTRALAQFNISPKTHKEFSSLVDNLMKGGQVQAEFLKNAQSGI
jgi:flagellar biosynthesis protein FlhG